MSSKPKTKSQKVHHKPKKLNEVHKNDSAHSSVQSDQPDIISPPPAATGRFRSFLRANPRLFSPSMIVFVVIFAVVAGYFIYHALAYFPDPPTVSITANGQHPNLTVNQGTDVVLNYSGDGQGNNINVCQFDTGGITPNPNSFHQPTYTGSTDLGKGLTPGTYTYTFQCNTAAGGATDTVTVTVNGSGGGGITVNVSSDPNIIAINNYSVIDWSVSGGTPAYCQQLNYTGSGGLSDPNWNGIGSNFLSGTQVVFPPQIGLYIYVVRCFDSNGNNIGHGSTPITAQSACAYNPNSEEKVASSGLPVVRLASCQGGSNFVYPRKCSGSGPMCVVIEDKNPNKTKAAVKRNIFFFGQTNPANPRDNSANCTASGSSFWTKIWPNGAKGETRYNVSFTLPDSGVHNIAMTCKGITLTVKYNNYEIIGYN